MPPLRGKSIAVSWTIYVCPTSDSPYTCGCELAHGEDCNEIEVQVVPVDEPKQGERLKLCADCLSPVSEEGFGCPVSHKHEGVEFYVHESREHAAYERGVADGRSDSAWTAQRRNITGRDVWGL